MVPDWITKTMVKQVVKTLKEGKSVQILHIGPYDKEAPILTRLHTEFMPTNSLIFNGKHHEIYLSDPRKVAPAKLRTILRQPVKKVAQSH